MRFMLLYFIVILLFLFINTKCNDVSQKNITTRSKRQLLFPRNCVLQFAVGVAVPSTLSYRKMAANAGILLNLELPDNLTYFSSPYSRTQKVSQHGLLEIMHNLNGMDGPACVKKSICQLKEVPFYGDNIFQQILQILFTPHHTNTTIESNCDTTYPKCPVSMIDFLTEIYEV